MGLVISGEVMYCGYYLGTSGVGFLEDSIPSKISKVALFTSA
jgi:hypothetical protein